MILKILQMLNFKEKKITEDLEIDLSRTSIIFQYLYLCWNHWLSCFNWQSVKQKYEKCKRENMKRTDYNMMVMIMVVVLLMINIDVDC